MTCKLKRAFVTKFRRNALTHVFHKPARHYHLSLAATETTLSIITYLSVENIATVISM